MSRLLRFVVISGLGLWFAAIVPGHCQTPVASTPASPDSAALKSSPSTHPDSSIVYDPKILKEIAKLSPKELTDPKMTMVRRDNLSDSALVWLQVRLDLGNKVREARVVYCSAPGMGLEQVALDATKGQTFSRKDIGRRHDWLWHGVIFTRSSSSDSGGSLDRPSPDVDIPVDVQPEMLYQQAPQFPVIATGVVWIKVLVGREGLVKEAMVLKSSGSSELDKAALTAAYHNRFKPAIQDAKPVAVWVTYKVEFKLNQ